MNREKQLEFDFPRANQSWILKHAQLRSCIVEQKNGKTRTVTSGTLKSVLRAIDDYAYGTGTAWASVDTLAAGANLSPSTVKLALTALRSQQVSILHVVFKKSTYGKVLNHYRIIWSELALYVPSEDSKADVRNQKSRQPIFVPFAPFVYESEEAGEPVDEPGPIADSRPSVPHTDSRQPGTDSRQSADRWPIVGLPIADSRPQIQKEHKREDKEENQTSPPPNPPPMLSQEEEVGSRLVLIRTEKPGQGQALAAPSTVTVGTDGRSLGSFVQESLQRPAQVLAGQPLADLVLRYQQANVWDAQQLLEWLAPQVGREYLEQLLAYWQANQGNWDGAGALRLRLKRSRPDLAIADGWPPTRPKPAAPTPRKSPEQHAAEREAYHRAKADAKRIAASEPPLAELFLQRKAEACP